MATKQKYKGQISVADYLSQQILLSGKAQKEIAEELNYPKPNIITMFKQGKTKVPLNKVSAFAKALGVDPIHLLRIVMIEYSPSTWEVLESIIGNAMMSDNEMKVLTIIREHANGLDIAPETETEKQELARLAEKWKARAEKSVDAAKRRIEVK